MKVKATRINLYAAKLSKAGGMCMTSGMVKKLNAPPKMFVEVDSLIEWLTFTNKKYNNDDFSVKEANDEFIAIISGSLKHLASPKEDIEWI